MGFSLKGLVNSAISLGSLGTIDTGDSDASAILSGIPFVGEGFAQEDQQAFNAQQAQINRSFQERMSKNRHQYEAQDLEKAGLNRILGVGTGASAPAGSMASSSAISGGSSSANMVKDMYNQVREKNKAEMKKINQDKKVAEKMEEVVKKKKETEVSTAARLNAETKRINLENEKAETDAQFNRENRGLINTAKKANLISDTIGNFIGNVTSGIRNIFTGKPKKSGNYQKSPYKYKGEQLYRRKQ